MKTTTSATKLRSQPEPSWSVGRRWLVSGLLVGHLIAVFVPPFAFQTSPVRGLGSPVAEAAMQSLRPYIEAIYLNHGYAFFAPDPGPSHLLVARLEFDDGRESLVLTYPDLDQHWPRLLYHRHFMLSEHLHGAFAPERAPPEIADDPAQRDAWQFTRRRYEKRLAAAEHHLRSRYGADRVQLTRVEHLLLAPLEVIVDGKRLDDPDTYVELSEDYVPEEMR